MRNQFNMTNICADCLVEIALGRNAGNAEDARRNLHEWITSYTEDSELGAMLFSPNYHVSYIPVKSWDMLWLRKDGSTPKYEDFDYDDWNKEYLRAHELGIEPYKIAIEETHKAGVEAWFSVRMNEFHYLRYPHDSASLWNERPDLRMAEDKAFDYAKKEVRDYYLAYIRELCESYDVDGVELDMWRGPEFFNPPITAQKVQIITDFLKEIRAAVNCIAAKKGKKIRISARTDIHPNLALKRGWDSAQWIADGSVDVLTLAVFWVPSPCEVFVKEWVERIAAKGGRRDQYGLNVCADSANFCMKYNEPGIKWLKPDTVNLKGFAATHFDRGVDGLYTFNINNRDYQLPRENREVDFTVFMSKGKVRKGERRHILAYNEENPANRAQLKALLAPGESLELKLHTSTAPQKGRYVVEIGINQPEACLGMKLNGKVCRYIGKPEGPAYEAAGAKNVKAISEVAPNVLLYEPVTLDGIVDGENVFEIQNKGRDSVEITWFSVDAENEC